LDCIVIVYTFAIQSLFMKPYNFKDYKYKELTPNPEGGIIGYGLFTSGYINEDLTEIDPVCITVMMNKEPLADYAKIKHIAGELFISPIHYSRYGNYVGDEQQFITITESDFL
jgi:hypothetical protein